MLESILARGPKLKILLDYGRYDLKGKDPLMRTYKDGRLSRDYLYAGQVDITYNVDFHLLTIPFRGMRPHPFTAFQGALARPAEVFTLASKLGLDLDAVADQLREFIRAAFLSWTYVGSLEAHAFPELWRGRAFDLAFSGPGKEKGSFESFHEPMFEQIDCALASQKRADARRSFVFAQHATKAAADVVKDMSLDGDS